MFRFEVRLYEQFLWCWWKVAYRFEMRLYEQFLLSSYKIIPGTILKVRFQESGKFGHFLADVDEILCIDLKWDYMNNFYDVPIK